MLSSLRDPDTQSTTYEPISIHIFLTKDLDKKALECRFSLSGPYKYESEFHGTCNRDSISPEKVMGMSAFHFD